MSNLVVVVLKVLVAVSLAGSVVVQVAIVPLLGVDLAGADSLVRWGVPVVAVLGVVTLQVFGVCVWILLGYVRADTVFSAQAFRYVNTVIGAIAASSALAFVLGFVLAAGQTAPGLVALIGGAGLVLAGIALLVLVMRRLLEQAIEMHTELDQVV